MTAAAVTIAYRTASGWALVPAALYDAPPANAARARSIPLAGGPDIRVLCAPSMLDLDAWGAPQILARARRWLIDAEYAHAEGGRLVVNWRRVERDTEPMPESDTVSDSQTPTPRRPLPTADVARAAAR